ncbi:MAG: RNA 2',3'-cyclic phosphodiesterase [Candidatus Sulfotelmatobacter sp.]|jgi:RNA 2',3'-cyclic 3'-phosphodiesterase
MRLFVALDIDEAIRERIANFLAGVREFAPDARWVRPESLHVTLKFIGETSEGEGERIESVLSVIEADRFEMDIRGYGFFPSARAPRVFWIGVVGDSRLASLAAKVEENLEAVGVKREEHAFHAHLTLARGGGASGAPRRLKSDRPNRNFQRLQEKLAALPAPEFGKMIARELFLYQSQLSPRGSKYTKLAAFPLR